MQPILHASVKKKRRPPLKEIIALQKFLLKQGSDKYKRMRLKIRRDLKAQRLEP